MVADNIVKHMYVGILSSTMAEFRKVIEYWFNTVTDARDSEILNFLDMHSVHGAARNNNPINQKNI